MLDSPKSNTQKNNIVGITGTTFQKIIGVKENQQQGVSEQREGDPNEKRRVTMDLTKRKKQQGKFFQDKVKFGKRSKTQLQMKCFRKTFGLPSQSRKRGNPNKQVAMVRNCAGGMGRKESTRFELVVTRCCYVLLLFSRDWLVGESVLPLILLDSDQQYTLT